MGLDTTEIQSGVAKAKNVFRNFAGAVAGYMSFSFAKKIIDQFDAIGKRAKDLDMSASGMLKLKETADLAGVGFEKVEQGLKSFSQRAAEGDESFAKLGISLTDNNGAMKTTEALLHETADKFKELKGSSDVASASWKLFGGDALEMTRVLEQGSDAIKDLSSSAKQIDSACDAAARFNDQLASLEHTAVRCFAHVLDSVSGLVEFAQDLWNGQSLGTTRLNKETARFVEQQQKQQQKLQTSIQRAEEKRVEAAKKADADYMAHYKATEEERLKILAEIFIAEEKFAFENLSLHEKVAQRKKEVAELEAEISTYDKDSIAYARTAKELSEKKIDLFKLEKDYAAKIKENRKAELEHAKQLRDTEQNNLNLLKERAKIVNDVLAQQKQARDANRNQLAGDSGARGQAARNAREAQSYADKADKAWNEGRYNDYAKYKRRQEAKEQRSDQKQAERLDKQIDDAKKRGDSDTADRLQKEKENRGLDKTKNKKDVESRVKDIDDKLKQMAEDISTMVGALDE